MIDRCWFFNRVFANTNLFEIQRFRSCVYVYTWPVFKCLPSFQILSLSKVEPADAEIVPTSAVKVLIILQYVSCVIKYKEMEILTFNMFTEIFLVD